MTLKRVVRLNQNRVEEVNDRVWCLSFVRSLLRVNIFTLHSQFQKVSHLEVGQGPTANTYCTVKMVQGSHVSFTDWLPGQSVTLPAILRWKRIIFYYTTNKQQCVTFAKGSYVTCWFVSRTLKNYCSDFHETCFFWCRAMNLLSLSFTLVFFNILINFSGYNTLILMENPCAFWWLISMSELKLMWIKELLGLNRGRHSIEPFWWDVFDFLLFFFEEKQLVGLINTNFGPPAHFGKSWFSQLMKCCYKTIVNSPFKH